MKRRDFLAGAAALSLLVSEAWGAKKQDKKADSNKSAASGKSGNKSNSKPAASGKPAANARGSKANSSKPNAKEKDRKGSKGSRNVHPAPAPVYTPPPQPVVHTADDPVIERPPQGTSATKLPPVKAPEPPSEWRTFEVTTTINLRGQNGPVKFWLPLPLNQDTLYQRTLGHSWSGNPANASMRRLPDGNLEVFLCEWPEASEARLQLTTLVTTADRHFDVTKRTVAPEREDILRQSLQATSLIPNDGLAFQLGERILGRIKDPVAQAKAIYDWVVDNTIYDPSLEGCGTGNVRKQLINGRYGGRSADINGLFVAICRAIGIPARCVYGLRSGSSRLFRSLGLSTDDASRGQHVRAEFYVPGYGWIPVDPSDVRRAIALEAISDRDSRLGALRKVLFGVWEMNWIAFNVGSDIQLPGRTGATPFLLHPQLESHGRLENTLSGNPQYSIKTRQVVL